MFGFKQSWMGEEGQGAGSPTGEEVKMSKVGTENSQTSNSELSKRTSILTVMAMIRAAQKKAQEQKKRNLSQSTPQSSKSK